MTDDASDDPLVHSEARRKLEGDYKILFDGVSAILLRHDPIGLNFEENLDEYDPEVGTVLPRLSSCSSIEDVQRILHEEFVRWFDAQIAGPPALYSGAAAEIWALWQELGARLPEA